MLLKTDHLPSSHNRKRQIQEMLQNQLDDFWSDSIPLLLLSHIACSLHRFFSLLLRFFRFPSHPPAPPHLDHSFLSSIGSGLASLILLSDHLDSNRSLSLPFDSSRHSSFGRDCAVCMSDLTDGDDVRVLGCRHVYHKGCLDQCLRHQLSTCPLCKSPILSASGNHQLATAARVGEGLLSSFAPSVMGP